MEISKTIRKETKEQKGGFLGKLLATLGTNLLGKMLVGKVIVIAIYGNKGQRTVRAGFGYDSKDF